MINTSKIGLDGETLAVRYLKNKGYDVIERNYQNKLGEIDIIAVDGGVIVFVEVKALKNTAFCMPLELITPHKVRNIRNTATAYLQRTQCLDRQIRFDAIEIIGENVRHIENCF